MDYNKGDIYDYLPDVVRNSTAYKETKGVAETLATLGTSIPAQIGGVAKGVYDAATHTPNEKIPVMEKWLEKNKQFAGNSDYAKVQHALSKAKSQEPDFERDTSEAATAMTYAPRSDEGKRNITAIGETLEDYKIPAFIPGVGNVGRVGFKGKPKAKKINHKKDTETSETLFTRAKMYFDQSKEAQVDFNSGSVSTLIKRMRKKLNDENISGMTSYGKQAQLALDKMELQAMKGKPVNINQIFEFKDLVDDIQTITKPKSKLVSGFLRDEIDDFITMADESVISKTSRGNKTNIDAFKTAQKYYGKAKNTGVLENLLENAKMRAGANYSQAQLTDAMKKEVQSLVKSERKSKYFTSAQKETLRDFVKGGNLEAFLKQASKLDPTSGGWVIGTTPAITGLGALAGMDGGASLALYGGLGVAGKAAKEARSIKVKNEVNKLMNNIQNRDVDVNTGFKQLDLNTDLGLLALPKEDIIKNQKDLELKGLLENGIKFPQGNR